MVWALVLVCVAGIAIVVIRSRKAEEPKPIVAVPVPTPKKTPIGPQLRAKSTTAQPPLDAGGKTKSQPPIDAGGKTKSQPPLDAGGKTTSQPPVDGARMRTPTAPPSAAPMASALMTDSEPIAVPERGAYATTELEYDPANTPEIPLAEQPRTKTKSAPPINVEPAPIPARTKSATIPPVVRARAPSIPPAVIPAADPATDSGVRIRASRPSSAPPVASDSKKGTPAKGVVVRKPPTLPPDPQRRGTPAHGIALRSKTPGAVQQIAPPDMPPVVVPDGLSNKLRYMTLTANISHVGIDAKREDGLARVVMWPDVVGIVARRLPADAPFDGVTFIDLVSTAGCTLRILPWTLLTGDAIVGDGVERARAFCQLVAARCRGAKLDPATRTFIGSHGQAAQLPDADTLDAHDKRLA